MILVPIVSSIFVYFASKKLAEKTGWISFAALCYTLLLCLKVAAQTSDERVLIENYEWSPNINLNLTLRADGLSVPFIFAIILLSTAVSIYSMPYMKHRIEERREQYGLFYGLYLFYAAGMIGTTLTTNLLSFYIFYELMLVPSFLIILKWGYGERERISLIYFLWTHAGALTLLAGILSMYAISGSFDLFQVSAYLTQSTISPHFLLGIAIAMSFGFFVKMAIFGFHIWLPHAHAEAPAPLSALLSPAMIGIGGYALVRIIFTLFPNTFESINVVIMVWALITIVYGSLMALTQNDFKRLLAYSSMSQMGYMLFGIASQNLLGVSGSMFHYLSHGMSKGVLFMVAGAIILQAEELRDVNMMGGLSSRMPITTMSALIGFLGLIGVPLTSGFHSEWMIFSGAFHVAVLNNSIVKFFLAFGGIIATFLTACYALWTMRRIFFGYRPEYLDHVEEAPITMTVPMLVLSAITVLLGIFPGIIVDLLLPVVSSLIG